MSNRYALMTVQDFMTLPPDRIDECLAQFSRALKYQHEVCALLGFEPTHVRIENFVWTDDGKKGITSKFMTGDHEIATFKVEEPVK